MLKTDIMMESTHEYTSKDGEGFMWKSVKLSGGIWAMIKPGWSRTLSSPWSNRSLLVISRCCVACAVHSSLVDNCRSLI